MTCPLDVVKTRLQSSQSGFDVRVVPMIARSEASTKVTCKTLPQPRRRMTTQVLSLSNCGSLPNNAKSMGLIQCLR